MNLALPVLLLRHQNVISTDAAHSSSWAAQRRNLLLGSGPLPYPQQTSLHIQQPRHPQSTRLSQPEPRFAPASCRCALCVCLCVPLRLPLRSSAFCFRLCFCIRLGGDSYALPNPAFGRHKSSTKPRSTNRPRSPL